MKRVAIVDVSGFVVNIAVWDGVTPWDPSQQHRDCKLVDLAGLPALDISAACVVDEVVIKSMPIVKPPAPVKDAAVEIEQ